VRGEIMPNGKPIEIACVQTPKELIGIKAGVQALFFDVFGKRLNDKAWEHYYLNSPYGNAAVFIAMVGSRIIAHGGIIPQLLGSVTGESIPYYLQTAIMVDEKYRNLIVFKKLMDAIHSYVEAKKTFVIAFPNDHSFGPFVKLLKWKKITEYNISQYEECNSNCSGATGSAGEYRYDIKIDRQFLSWRGELNGIKKEETSNYKMICKEYEGALEILYVDGHGIDFREIMKRTAHKRINIPDCFLPYGKMDGLIRVGQVGIPQRFCAYPGESDKMKYSDIKPSLLLSDVF